MWSAFKSRQQIPFTNWRRCSVKRKLKIQTSGKSSKWKSWSVEHWYIMILRHSRLQGCWMLILKWLWFTPEIKSKLQQKRQSMQRALSKWTSLPLWWQFPQELSNIAIRWSGWKSLSLWWSLGKVPLQGAVLWQALLFQGLWRPLGTVYSKVASL